MQRIWNVQFCFLLYEFTRGTVYFHLQSSREGVIFHKSTTRLRILYLSLLSLRWSGYQRQQSGSLRAGWFSVQTLVGTRFLASVQTSPKAHPVSCIVSVLGIKRLGCGNYHPPPSSTELVITNLYLCSAPCLHGI
jgi:hypothetical protein